MGKMWPWIIGGAVGAGIAYVLGQQKIANAYALGQANPTTAYTSLTPAQHAQISGAALPSPPPVSTQIQNVSNQMTAGYR